MPPFALPAPPACSVFPAFFAAPARSPARRGVRRRGSCRASCLPRPFVDEPRGTPSNSAAPWPCACRECPRRRTTAEPVVNICVAERMPIPAADTGSAARGPADAPACRRKSLTCA
ncbi:hypothetical protein D0U02_12900 [Burkholderia pseudomallei]|nr:hypothetical protein BOC51_11195 [Burkholderia pseudomallei]AYX34781.1 hypothetical protein EGY15_06115 [Burkholderia pseudomallei]RFS61329.1 hypothetical protein D0U05_04165 [Burkholderia pseudomallei]RFS63372.1 hypothetical protein D0U02_12900 [Burkholderia pseudomallei]RFS69569.1 hypothetical protein D0U01_07650 [Burkholderia pseudomallei]